MSESAHRWCVKKAARGTVMLGSYASAAIAIRRAHGRPRVRVLTYHRFGRVARDPWYVTPEDFEAQIRWIAEERRAVGLADLLHFVRGEAALPDGAVMVTMDDGMQSVLKVAAPILQHYGVPAVLYVTTSAIGNPEAGRGAGEEFLTWDEVSRLAATGMVIGSHGHTHSSMARLSPERVRAEGEDSKRLIESRLGLATSSFAYPYGMRRDESPQTLEILAACGFQSIFISQHGTVQAGDNPLRLPRIKVEAGEPLAMFRRLCRGGMDLWELADRLR